MDCREDYRVGNIAVGDDTLTILRERRPNK